MPERVPVTIPHRPLVEGERLDQPTFHARYQAMPPGTRAELIGGVVFMPSPVGREHGREHVPVIVWLSYYAENTPGVEVLDNATTVLGPKSEPQPDALLRVVPECGGRSGDDREFIGGAPELVVEISGTTSAVDLGPKRADYEQAGVLEYVVRALDPDEVRWFQLKHGALTEVPSGEDGFYRSSAFPGLWLDPLALVNGNTRRLRAVVDLGLASREHAEFVARLANARKSS
jgi:Uma2 family endonuclease